MSCPYVLDSSKTNKRWLSKKVFCGIRICLQKDSSFNCMWVMPTFLIIRVAMKKLSKFIIKS
jgi:hypothetical protein